MMLALLLLAPTVAVMPFADLSSSGGTVGDAIRETVTSDLKELSGLRVIERARIDQVLAEQKLQESRADLDPASSARVGKLLGASLICTGAYQKVAQNVRLTARFVRVESGEIIGSAKVDGKVADFLSLQDRITGELLKSAGMAASGEAMARRARPKLKSARTMELYGDAVITDDPEKKKKLLQEALDEDPQFSYAARDLDALEKRLQHYDANAAREGDALIAKLEREITVEKNRDELNMKYNQILGRLMSQRRWRRLISECAKIRRAPPPLPTHTGVLGIVELCDFDDLAAYHNLRDFTAVLRDGEKFVARYPTSIWFDGARNLMESAMREQRDRDKGRAPAERAVAALPAGERKPCRVWRIWRDHHQDKESQRALEACIAGGGERGKLSDLYEQLKDVCERSGDFGCQRRSIEALKTVDPEKYERERGLLPLIGRDD